MNPKQIDVLKELLKADQEEVLKMNQIVADALQEEKLIVHTLQNKLDEKLSTGQRLSDKVASFGGSWKFIIFFFIVLAGWILFNLLAKGRASFDPYPFILMNLVLSCVAAIQAPIIMMSQNRKEEKDRERAENDYMVNLKAEIQIRALHQKIDLLMHEQLKKLNESQAMQLEMLRKIAKEDDD